MALRPEEVTSIIKKELEKYRVRLRVEAVGTVLQVGDGIALVYGLDDVMVGELVQFYLHRMGIFCVAHITVVIMDIQISVYLRYIAKRHS